MNPSDCGVIFDMDGVLADTAEAHYQSWQVVAAEYGTRIGRDLFHETFGRPNHQVIPHLIGREVDEDELRAVDRMKEEAFRRIAADSIEPVPGVVELIRDLRSAGYRVGLGSSGPRENIEAILSALGVRQDFEAVVSGWDVQQGKPAPDVFLMVAERLGVPAGNCLVVEDVAAGIRAAQAAGMPCVALTTTHGPEQLTEADLVLEDLRGFGVGDVARILQEAAQTDGDSTSSVEGSVR